jgi:hypothetical protein
LRNHGRPTFHRSGGGACAERAGEHDRNDERHGCDLTGYEGTPSRCRDARASGGKAQLHEAHEDRHPPPLRKPLEHAPSAAQQQMGDRLDDEQPETRSTSDHSAQQTATADCGGPRQEPGRGSRAGTADSGERNGPPEQGRRQGRAY